MSQETGEATEAGDVDLGAETAKATAARFAMAAVGFAGTVLFARVLGPTAFGGFYLLYGLVKLADRPIVGWATASKKRFSETDAPGDEILGAQLLVWGGVVAAGVLVAVVAATPMRSYTGLAAAPVLFVALLATEGLYEPIERFVQARGRVGAATMVDTVRSLLTLPLQLGFVLLAGAAGMAYGLAAASVAAVPLAFRYVHGAPARPAGETLADLWAFARYSVPTSYFSTAYDRFDVLLLGLLLAPGAAGQYEVAAKLTLPATFLASAVAGAMLPRVSNLRSKGGDVATDVSNALAFVSLLSVPLLVGAAVLAGPLLRTVYGPAYAGAGALLVGLASYRVVRSQTAPLLQVINGLDRPRTAMAISGTALALNVVAGVALTLRYGAVGVVVATVLAESVTYVAAAAVVKREVADVTLLPRALLEQAAAAAAMGVVVAVLHGSHPVRSWLDLLALVGVGAAVYGGVLWLVSARLRLTVAAILRRSRIGRHLPVRTPGR